MSLQGFYTTWGRARGAMRAAGTGLTITRVTAGSGETAESAAALAQERQTLTVGEAAVSGQSAVLPTTLAEAGASAAYTLTELGVYARDPQEGEILYQVFRLDAPRAVTKGGEDTLRFVKGTDCETHVLAEVAYAEGVEVTLSASYPEVSVCYKLSPRTDFYRAPVALKVMGVSYISSQSWLTEVTTAADTVVLDPAFRWATSTGTKETIRKSRR